MDINPVELSKSNISTVASPDIEWAILKSIRNILVHEYFGIDYDIIWNSIKTNIPDLKVNILKIIKEL